MSKMLRVSDTLYERIKREKRPDESFNDVLARHFPKGSLLDLAGLSTPEEAEEAERLLDEIDKLSEEKMDRTLRERGLL